MKKTILAVAAGLLVSGAAVPAFATPFGDGDSDMRAQRQDAILTALQDKGVNTTEVEEWGTLVRAFVTQPDGTQIMEYFVPGSLKRVDA